MFFPWLTILTTRDPFHYNALGGAKVMVGAVENGKVGVGGQSQTGEGLVGMQKVSRSNLIRKILQQKSRHLKEWSPCLNWHGVCRNERKRINTSEISGGGSTTLKMFAVLL